MFAVNVKSDSRAVEIWLRGAESATPGAQARAINRAAQSVRAHAGRDAAKKLKTKVGPIKKRVVHNRKHRATKRRPRAVIYAIVKPLRARLIGKARNYRKGRKSTLGGAKVGKHQFTNSFVQTTRSGYVSVWHRTTKKSYPITETLFEIREPLNDSVQHHVNTTARDVYTRRMVHEMDRAFKRGLR